MNTPTLFVVEDEANQINVARVIAEKFELDLLLAENLVEAMDLISQVKKIRGDVIFCLDGEFPSEENMLGNPGPVLLERIGRDLPSNTFFIPNSSYLEITDKLIDIWSNTLSRSNELILSQEGKPHGLINGVKRYKLLQD